MDFVCSMPCVVSVVLSLLSCRGFLEYGIHSSNLKVTEKIGSVGGILAHSREQNSNGMKILHFQSLSHLGTFKMPVQVS